jgi:drug/metabolite transporter (DMT)-like permease
LSGSITSAIGYVFWYGALRGLTATRAAIVQLAVPVLAALAGVLVLSETISLRLVLSAIAILSGVALAVSHPRIAVKAQALTDS